MIPSEFSNSNGLQWTPMGFNGKKLLDHITLTLIYNLQLQWTPMGSNGKHNCVQKMMTPSEFSNSNGLQWAPVISNFLIRLLLPIYNLQLQWTPMGSNDKLHSVQNMLIPSEFSNSNGLKWAPMENNFLIRLLSSSSSIYNSNGLQW